MMSKALVQLCVNRAEDGSANIYYLGGLEHHDGLKAKMMAPLEVTAEPYVASSNQEVTLCKLKVGFPAFHVGAIQFARNVLERMPDKSLFYVSPDWHIPDLVPTARTVGAEDDPIRQSICLGLTLNVLRMSSAGCFYGDVRLGATEEESAAMLR